MPHAPAPNEPTPPRPPFSLLTSHFSLPLPARQARAALVLFCIAALFAPLARAQTEPPTTIREDTVWRDQITISRDVRITQATVRVEPGTVIRFVAPRPGAAGAVIRLSGASPTAATPRTRARLILDGTPTRPIIVETPPGQPRGAIDAAPMTGCSIIARHAIFRRLGTPISAQRCNPALFLVLNTPENDLWLRDCRFEQCGPVHAEFIGVGPTAEIHRCTFTESADRAAIIMIGTGEGLHVVTDNVADAGFRFECPHLLVRDNVLVGDAAAITAINTGEGIAIVGNYVHCTSTTDDGRYVLRCQAPHPQAHVSDNVLRGGTYVIESAPTDVTGNVLIGAAGLSASLPLPGSNARQTAPTTTHYLLTNLPPSANVTDNLFLGPAYAAIALNSPATGARIQHNLFDGWHAARRAVHFNTLPTARPDPLVAVFTRNVIARYGLPPVVDAAKRAGTLASASTNLFIEVETPPYEKLLDVPQLPPDDRLLPAFANLGFPAPAATQAAADLDQQLLRRQITPAAARQAWLNAYTAAPNSPLADGRAGPRRQEQNPPPAPQ